MEVGSQVFPVSAVKHWETTAREKLAKSARECYYVTFHSVMDLV